MYIYTCVLFGTLIPTAIQILIALISKGLHMVLLLYAITPALLHIYVYTVLVSLIFGTAIPTFNKHFNDFTLVYMRSSLSPNTFYTYMYDVLSSLACTRHLIF